MNRSADLQSSVLDWSATPLRDSEGACRFCAGLDDQNRWAYLENVAGQWLAGGEISYQTMTTTNANANSLSLSKLGRYVPRPCSTLQVVGLLLFLAGCSGGVGPLKGYEHGNGDLRDFIVKAVPKLGVHLLQTNALPSVPGRWRYQSRPDELAVVVEGDCFPLLHAFLTNAIGAAQGSPIADKTTGVMETYYGTNLTATVCCRSGIIDAGKKYTSLVIVGYGTAAGQQAAYAQLLREAVGKANDSHSALDAARLSAPYVSDFVRLFPNAEVRYRSFGGGMGFDVNVDLFDRYEFTMQLPVVFDSSRSKVIDYGEPRFTLWEAASVKRNKSGIAETTLNPAGERRFGPTEWQKIVEAGGDFGAIGYTMHTNRPVPGFSGRKMAIAK
jgi:hypothetical protein